MTARNTLTPTSEKGVLGNLFFNIRKFRVQYRLVNLLSNGLHPNHYLCPPWCVITRYYCDSAPHIIQEGLKIMRRKFVKLYAVRRPLLKSYFSEQPRHLLIK